MIPIDPGGEGYLGQKAGEGWNVPQAYSIFLFELANPLLQELPLWFLLG